MRTGGLIAVFLAFFTTISYAQNNAQQTEVVMKMQLLKTALVAKDSVSLSSLLSDDVTYGHSNAMVQTKAELIRSVMSGEQDYNSIEPSDMNVRVYDNAAVVTLKLKVNLVYGGKPTDLNLSATFTWVKINGDWKLVARQSTRLPDQ